MLYTMQVKYTNADETAIMNIVDSDEDQCLQRILDLSQSRALDYTVISEGWIDE